MTDPSAPDVVCPECGAHNPSGEDFCEKCDAYLAWDRTVPSTRSPSPDTGTVSPPVRTTTDTGATRLPTQAGSSAGAVPSTNRPEPEPELVKPGEAAPRPRPRDMHEVAPPSPGEIQCPVCKTGNPRGRHFCRRCGADLSVAETQAPELPTDGQRDQPEQPPPAGTRWRPSGNPLPVGLLVMLVLLALVGVGLYLSRAAIASTVAQVGDRLSPTEDVKPDGVTGSPDLPEHGPGLVNDDITDTYWAASPAPNPAVPPGPEAPAAEAPHLLFTFPEPFRLVHIQMIPGASDIKETSSQQGRPLTVQVMVTRQDGSETTRVWQLAEKPGIQRFRVGVDDVETVRITILKSRPPLDESMVAVAEVEFRGRGLPDD